MGFWALLKLAITYLPQLVGFLKMINRLISRGATQAEIKSKIKDISKAFLLEDRIEAAGKLDDLFKK